MKMKRYSFRLLKVWEKYNEQELKQLKEFDKKREEKNMKVLERIRKTEKDWKVFVEWLGRVESF